MKSKITLNYPVTTEGVEVDTIYLRRPRAKDLKKMEDSKGGDITKSIELIADLAELVPSAIEDLDAGDFQKVNEVVAGFLGQR
ncbi:phage tail assembly protein [Zooshikella harenae]|uniref:Phage tail assembly protein n=1 Tax=Zooshikella harenae TaxID=2827238 RepID=A0ABS5ZHU4_9GAMM|nr:phage tail assembly protein [Zooshikella harenae]MBU2713636.1 phage tail assembly protein [Zooshikella harenae]